MADGLRGSPHVNALHVMMDTWNVASRRISSSVTDVLSGTRLHRAARRHARQGKLQLALDDYTRLVREVGLARESISTYRHVDALLHRVNLETCGPPAGSRPRRFLLFVGYSRSGHSLVGSLLDAHPNVAVSHELHAVKHLRNGVPFDGICRAICLNSWLYQRGGRAYTGYDYRVPGQHQGSVEQLAIAGDKKGNGTLRLMRRRPGLLNDLMSLVPVPLTLVHVIRNPYDNIATRARRKGVSLENAARGYLANARLVAQLKQQHPEQVVDVYLDDLIAAPQETLAWLLQRLELPVPPGYLDACASIVFDRPSLTRFTATWQPQVVRSIREAMDIHPFLARFADTHPTAVAGGPP